MIVTSCWPVTASWLFGLHVCWVALATVSSWLVLNWLISVTSSWLMEAESEAFACSLDADFLHRNWSKLPFAGAGVLVRLLMHFFTRLLKASFLCSKVSSSWYFLFFFRKSSISFDTSRALLKLLTFAHFARCLSAKLSCMSTSLMSSCSWATLFCLISWLIFSLVGLHAFPTFETLPNCFDLVPFFL